MIGSVLAKTMVLSGNENILASDIPTIKKNLVAAFLSERKIKIDDGYGGFVVAYGDVTLVKFEKLLDDHSYRAEIV